MGKLKITRACKRCGTDFHPPTGNLPEGRGRFCSKACWYATKKKSPEDRFWNKVDKTPGQGPKGDCWEWTARRFNKGYGQFRDGITTRRANRFVWEITSGAIPGQLFVLHRCDNPPCVRPDHLFLGTQADNAQDMIGKNRQAAGNKHGSRLHPERAARGKRNGAHTHPEKVLRGSKQGGAKLDEAMVLDIRSRAAFGPRGTMAALAREHGVSQSVISCVMLRKTWVHV